MVGLVLATQSCTKDQDDNPIFVEARTANEFDSEVVVEWYALIKTLTTETQGYTPPVAARAFGYTGVALYEAVVSGIPNRTSLSGKLNELRTNLVLDGTKTYHWPSVANETLAAMTQHFYANTSQERLDAIAALEAKFKGRFLAENGQEIYDSSTDLATMVSARIIEWSSSDGGRDAQFNNFPTNYSPPVGPEYWVPTPPNFTPALQPYWGANRPFLTADIEGAAQPEAPPAYSVEESSICYQRALEVYNVVNDLTPDQKAIAQFWSDDPVTTATPPGHSISILNQIIREKDLDLAVSAEAFAKLGIGISDAFISCWKAKYETLYPRPITYINAHIDPDWEPILSTPPFPEYTSGHSVQSGALAEIMTDLLGENYAFTDRTHENRTDMDGTPRSFNNFYELAEEAAVSRLYGGIHFKEAIEAGLQQGYQIGRNVNALNLDK